MFHQLAIMFRPAPEALRAGCLGLFVLLLLIVGNPVNGIGQERPAQRASFAGQQTSIKVDVLVGQSRLIEFDEDYDRVSI